ncbi:MAG: DUF1853 family protein [Agitococcus sp.]
MWQSFTHPHVRNLAWVLASPSLLSYLPNTHYDVDVLDDDFWSTQYLAYIPKLLQLDCNPQPLEFFLARHNNHRLGYYFEYLLQFWLQDRDFHYFELIKHRATLFDGKTTVGELDFLVKNHQTGQIEHWEAAVKFYLGYEPLNDAYCWWGANDNDRLGNKLQHLAHKQFSHLSYEDWTIERRCLVVKGRLFYPLSRKTLLERTQSESLNCLAAQHLQGSHLLWSEFIKHPQARLLQWRYAGKDEWFANQQQYKQLLVSSPQQLPLLNSQRAELVIGFDEVQQEQARCFVRVAQRCDISNR